MFVRFGHLVVITIAIALGGCGSEGDVTFSEMDAAHADRLVDVGNVRPEFDPVFNRFFFVYELYFNLLGRNMLEREYDPDTMAYYYDVAMPQDGCRAVARAFYHSREFQHSRWTHEPGSFVGYMYTGLLGRFPDPTGWNEWVDVLLDNNQSAASKELVFDSIIGSREFAARCALTDSPL